MLQHLMWDWAFSCMRFLGIGRINVCFTLTIPVAGILCSASKILSISFLKQDGLLPWQR